MSKIKIDFCSETWSLGKGVNVRDARSTVVPTTFFLLEKVKSLALRLGTWLSFSPKLGTVFTSISSVVASNLKIFQKTNLGNFFIIFTWHLTVSTLEDPPDSSKLSHINNTQTQPPPQALRFSHGRGERETSDWWYTARDHGKGTDGRRSPLSPSRLPLRAHRERRLGTRQTQTTFPWFALWRTTQ